MANVNKGSLPYALKWFINFTFNDLYSIWFSSKKSQLLFQVDDHSDRLIVDKIVGLIMNNDVSAKWPTADYFFNTNEKITDESKIETMTLCLESSKDKTNFSSGIVIIQPMDSIIVHSGQITVKPPEKTKVNMETKIEDFEGQVKYQ